MNLVVQVLLALVSVIVPIGFPAYLGMESYGIFVRESSAAFLTHRVCDLAGEGILGGGQIRARIVRFGLNHAVVGGVIVSAIAVLTDWPLSMGLLLSLLFSSIVFSVLFCLDRPALVVIYLTFFGVSMLILLRLSSSLGLSAIQFVAITNVVGGLVGVCLLAVARKAFAQSNSLSSSFSETTRKFQWDRFGLAVIPTSISIMVPIVTMERLAAHDIGVVKLGCTLLLFGPFLLPLNQKSLVVSLTKVSPHEVGVSTLLRSISKRLILATGVLFSIALLMSLTGAMPRNVAAVLPVSALFACCLVAERVLLHNNLGIQVLSAALVLSILLLVGLASLVPTSNGANITLYAVTGLEFSYAACLALISPSHLKVFLFKTLAAVAVATAAILLVGEVIDVKDLPSLRRGGWNAHCC